MVKVIIYQGDTLSWLRKLPAESVHCCVTSPPYWGLRDYGLPPLVWGGREDCQHEWGQPLKSPWADKVPGPQGLAKNSAAGHWRPKETGPFCRLCSAWRGCLGLEPTPELYLEHMVLVFRELRRVLRKDGTLWLNMGSSYNGSGGAGGDYNKGALKEGQPKFPGRHVPNFKPKDLVPMPWMLAMALQKDGWWLRRDIIWAKPNPMPESCTDRPTTAHEYIFLLTKDSKYFYDAEAVREEATAPLKSCGQNSRKFQDRDPAHPTGRKSKKPDGWATHTGGHGSFHKDGREAGAPAEIRSGRNLRSVWTIATQSFPDAHFATFPSRLPEICIRAGTSERGCCPKCGAPWRRWEGVPWGSTESTTTGWTPTCACDAGEPIPCTVLDNFAGVLTTNIVAAKLGRDSIAIELSPRYVTMGIRRAKQELGMLAEIQIDKPEPGAL